MAECGRTRARLDSVRQQLQDVMPGLCGQRFMAFRRPAALRRPFAAPGDVGHSGEASVKL